MNSTLYSGAGNTFALLDAPVEGAQAVQLCEKHDVDGVIFEDPPFYMRTFNRDGSEAEMCGNGLRCFVKYLADKGIQRDRYEIETLAGTQIAWIEGENVCVQLPLPTEAKWHLEIAERTFHHLNTGVPHALTFVDSVDSVDLLALAPEVRFHPFFPKGTNVNVVELGAPLRMRTYERGVERETLACGTGAIACALVASKLYALPSPIMVQVRSGEHLKISFTEDWSTLTMEGPAHKIEGLHL